ncbi:MAG: hypothetical protein MO852_15400, partial [Candidatus Devosia euplotis]|nr:hypothetical protein [Candidatus Devosia euplotis]
MPRFSTEDPKNTAPGEDGFGEQPGSGVTDQDDREDEATGMSDKDWLQMFRGALDASSGYVQESARTSWNRSYRAFNNRHVTNSKYETFKYRHRSKLFRPKTRMAVRKNLATSAAALFSTQDVVSVSPARESDPLQSMTARVLHEVLNYRLDRTNPKDGPQWFLTVVGARQDTQIAGRCYSKQYWEYEERDEPYLEDKVVFDVNGLPLTDEAGQIVMEEGISYRTKIVADRPECTLIPPEHAFVDPTADWRNPVQSGGYFIAGFPTRKEDLEDMVARQADSPKMGGGAWRSDIDIERLMHAANANQRQADAIRRNREDGADRYQSRHSDENGETIWLYECFYRFAGTDWHFWTLGENMLLSDPRPVDESYPEQEGMRPYTSGVGEVESHRVLPSSPVETWQPMQQEMNELTNLGLDALKMGISPITKIRKGRNVDL